MKTRQNKDFWSSVKLTNEERDIEDSIDLDSIKSRAQRSNIPYQTLLGVLFHKYSNGDIKLTI